MIGLASASVIDWLLGLSRLSWNDPHAKLDWRIDLPAWLWLVIIIGSILFAWGTYRHLVGRRAVRIFLAVVRAAVIVFLAMLLAQPMLVVTRERIETDWLIMLVDQSESMQIPDMRGGVDPITSASSRHAVMQQAVAKTADLFSRRRLGRNRHILWLGFDGGTFEVDPPYDHPLPNAVGQTTAIRTAIEQALSRAAGHRVTGIVLLSDGRTPQSTGADLVHRLKQHGTPIYTVPLGARATPLVLKIAQVDAPRKAYINDTVPVSVLIDRYPADAEIDPSRLVVRLVDPQTDTILDQKTATDGRLDEPIELTAESAVVGLVTWRVEVKYEPLAPAATSQGEGPDDVGADGAGVWPGQLELQKDQHLITIELIDRPIRVLYVEGYPRWEYRYLKSMLIREKSLRSSLMLVSADRAFAQEGDEPIARLPNDAEEIKPYDVIIIGDVPSGYFGAHQMALIRDQVAVRGAGLLWIGGARHTPRSYDGTALAALLPMRWPATVGRVGQATGPITVKPTPLARSLSVLRLRSLGEDQPGESHWPGALPGLMWAQQLGDLKPLAEPLAIGYGEGGTVGALVTRMRYGAGQVIYVATDDTWRWRYARGEYYFQQFWTQLVRMLGRHRIQQGGGRVRLSAVPRRPELYQPMVINLRIEDALLLKRDLPRIKLALERPPKGNNDGAAESLEQIDLLPKPLSRVGPTSTGIQDQAKEYQSIWRPSSSGRFVLRVVEPALEDLNIIQQIEVFRPDDEMRHPAPDHARLTRLAEQTGGQVVGLNELDRLTDLIREPARTADDIREPLWDSYLALLIAVTLLTMEWIGRKIIRLV